MLEILGQSNGWIEMSPCPSSRDDNPLRFHRIDVETTLDAMSRGRYAPQDSRSGRSATLGRGLSADAPLVLPNRTLLGMTDTNNDPSNQSQAMC